MNRHSLSSGRTRAFLYLVCGVGTWSRAKSSLLTSYGVNGVTSSLRISRGKEGGDWEFIGAAITVS